MSHFTNRRQFLKRTTLAATGLWATGAGSLFGPECQAQAEPAGSGAKKVFRAGAHAIDITPKQFPVISNGSFLERKTNKVNDPLHARCFVLDDGSTRVAIAVVDNCLMPRDLLDKAKALAQESTGIPTDRILISATHTHAGGSVMGALGSRADENYVRYLPGRIAEGISLAAKNLAPARVGWATVDDFEHTNCRRWILRSDRVGTDPFGGKTVHAMMHPGYQNPSYVGPAGPIDPGLTILSLQTPEGRPIALFANYSMHYFGASAISADYYGEFCRKVVELIGAKDLDPPFMAAMSQGTSGDLHWMDYSQPRKSISRDAYAEALARNALEACKKIEYHDWVPLAMCEKKLTLRRRVPDKERLAWAKELAATIDGPIPKNRTQVYALEQICLHENPVRELKLQAIRIGDLGITAIPNEVYGITGLKIKAQSPLQPTCNLELANGAEGYIPPPEQHALGGYTAWPARSAGLEVQAEPRIVQAVLSLLEEVSGKPRRKLVTPQGPYAKAVLESKPAAYWRLGEIVGPKAADSSGHENDGVYEDGVALYLEGPESPAFCGEGHIHRAAHFAGGRMKSNVPSLPGAYSVEMWFYNGFPNDARPVTGYMFSRGADGAEGGPGDHLGIGGTHTPAATGKLIFFNGDELKELAVGTTEIRPKTWHHVVLVRDGKKVTVYLDGNTKPEIAAEAGVSLPAGVDQLFIGGRSDNIANFEGKIDEVAVYSRALAPEEIARHYATADRK